MEVREPCWLGLSVAKPIEYKSVSKLDIDNLLKYRSSTA